MSASASAVAVQTPTSSAVIGAGTGLQQQQQQPGNETAAATAAEASSLSSVATSSATRRTPVQPVVAAAVDGARSASVQACAGCRHPIRDQYMLHVDPDLDWHAECLRCAECHRPLDESCTCFVRDGRPYCKPDYAR